MYFLGKFELSSSIHVGATGVKKRSREMNRKINGSAIAEVKSEFNLLCQWNL